MALAETAGLLAGGGEATELAMLHDGSADPLHLSIVADGLVEWIDHDHLEEFIGGVLANPV